jgi:hypothetical protein
MPTFAIDEGTITTRTKPLVRPRAQRLRVGRVYAFEHRSARFTMAAGGPDGHKFNVWFVPVELSVWK